MQTKNVAEWNGHLLAALVAGMVAGMVVLGSFAAPASAQESGGEQGSAGQEASDEKKAEAYYNKGVDAFFKKKYSLAITYFQRANTLDPDPVVLYNISLAHSKMGNPKEALTAALEAQKMGNLPEDTALKNQFRIVGYRRAIAAREVTEAINPPAKAEIDPNKVPDKQPQTDEGLSVLGWTGAGTAGLGVAALVGAGVTNFIVAGNLEEYDTAQADGDYGRARGLHQDIQDRQSLGRVMLYSGAGLAAVGGALLAYDLLGGTETAGNAESASVFGAVDSDGASVQLRWSF
ncbi:hypothetical protein FIV42_24030 [Persicimonas caeni]|uniref:Tetratricopeptide repeat protein n=1 Tax=Persicimonas caeni TaxID=2292766 RepID=A0A4Y6PZN1_PERCE|nr:hypothetical protein [Persicimonas caeni]QDG53700.1 hypothetical protein FIV42_24030 [Persicimonas caeni]QED34921.1 hypothetical protein FRD00_24025 [Persicimonas caeni]